MSFVTVEQVEYWINQSTNPTDPQVQWQSTQHIQEWIQLATTTNPNEEHRASVARICYELFVDPSKPTQVRFSALTTLGRIPLTTPERREVRHYLLHQFMASPSPTTMPNNESNHSDTETVFPVFFRNKAALILVQYILQDVGADGGTDNTASTTASSSAWPTIREDLMQLSEAFPELFLKTVETLLEAFVMAHEEPTAVAVSQNTDQNFDRESMRRIKDILKGYHNQPTRASQSQQTTLLECLFQRTISILRNAITASVNTAQQPGKNDVAMSIHVLALDTVKTFFQWTGDLSFLSSDKSETGDVVDSCLELLLQSIQPSRFPTSNIQLSSWKAWQEWMTTVSSTVPSSCSSTVVTIEMRSASDDEMDAPLPENLEQLLLKKMQVMEAILERIHEYEILPFQGGESTVVEIEVVIEVAKLITAFGLDMVAVWEDCSRVDEQDASAVERKRHGDTLFHEVLDLFFRAFTYDDIDVSGAVLPLATRFALSIMSVTASAPSSKQESHLMILLQQQMPKFLNIVYQQLKYDEDFGYDFEDDDDAEEEMYRTQLIKVYDKLVLAAPDICLQFVCEATRQQIIESGSNSNNASDATTTQDVEATLRLLYHYCEGVRPPPGMKTVMQNPTFVSLLFALHNRSDVILARFGHREVLCLYYETAVRYYPIFTQSPPSGCEYQQLDPKALLSKLLESLTGKSGLQHPHARVRSRCSYLLLRLVKSVVSQLRPLVEVAVSGIQSLLSSNASGDWIRPEDMLYLFETIGLLLGKTGLPGQEQQQYLAQVMTPHVRSIEQILVLPDLKNEVEQYGEILSNSVAAIAFLSKGFTKRPPDEVQVVLLEAVSIALQVLQALPISEAVRNKTMVFLQRMIHCTGTKLLVSIPDYLRLLIEHCTSEDVLFVAQLFNQLCIKFKEEAAPAIDLSLLPFLLKCQSLTPAGDESTSGGIVAPHLETERLAIQKLAFVVLNHTVTHNVTAVLLSPANAASLENVLQTMSNGAINIQEPAVKKTCIKFFREMTDQWTMPNMVGVTEEYRRGLIAYVCRTVVPGVLLSMFHGSFDERDAQQYRNVCEVINLILLVKERTGEFETMLTALTATGQVPASCLDGLRAAIDVKSVETALRPMFERKRDTKA